MASVDISVVIPVYGCRAALPELHRRLVDTLESMNKSFEIVLVDDCCPQNSWEEIKKICSADKRVLGIRLSRNFGQIRALTCGLDHAKGQWVVVMDCDLQDRPEAIPELWNKAQEGYDAVFVRRINRKDKKSTKFLSRSFYKVYNYLTDGSYDSSISNFSIASRQVIDNYCRMREHNRGYTTFLRWMGFKRAAIDVEGAERYEGHSSYTLRRKIRMAFELITSQSTKPLKLAVNFGFGVFFISLIYLICLLIYHAVVPDVAVGWTSIIGAIFLMGGLNIGIVGIVGLYVGNIFEETKNRPLYIIKSMMNDNGNSLEAKKQEKALDD